MANETQPDREPYRLIIARRKATEVLLSMQLSGLSLPRIEVPTGVRLAEQLVSRVKQNYQLETCCLFRGNTTPSLELPSPDRYAFMEAILPNNEAPAGTTWVPSARAAAEPNLPRRDQAALRSCFECLDCHLAPELGPFARPGWIDELFCWVRGVIEPLGVRTTGRFRQLNAGPSFSLLRIETTGDAVWFKATGEPNVHELPISIALHRVFPNYVPRILGVHPTWNAWLSEEVPGRAPDDPADARAWSYVAKALAQLQIASISKTDFLIESGCQDLRLDQLGTRIDPFLARVSELMGMQTKQTPPTLKDSELTFLGDALKAALFELEQHRIPRTLGHLDFNPGNILVSPARCCFLDWAEACVTHPLFTFEYLLEHSRRVWPEHEAVTKEVVAAYIGPWRSFFSPEALAQAMTTSALLAVFAYAVAGRQWCLPKTVQNPAHARYFRSLARRAYREATRIATRRERCLA